MRLAGIDLGSRAIKVVVVRADGGILEQRSADTTFDPLRQCQELLDGLRFDRIQATGYGRHLFRDVYEKACIVSEILAHARGAIAAEPRVRAVLDIGGQDTKAIALDPAGKVLKFEMNDRCAAGTGKFLEVMARAFGLSVHDFGPFAEAAHRPCKISSMCTVFAESEATSLMARGEPPMNIAFGLHLAVAARSVAMLRRVTACGPVAFTGGVARNSCIRRLLEDALEGQLLIAAEPQFIGALGAALLLRG
ncbi:MAG: acyl-CoA dehydratase activase [bacterium]